jgi:hypothetical protein
VHVLVDTLGTFERASGQQLNLQKSILLPVGPPHAVQAPLDGGELTVAGIPVKTSAVSMGVAFQAGLQPAQPKVQWQRLLDTVVGKAGKLAKLPLSSFGRAMGATTYALSKLLFYAEYTGLPSNAFLSDLHRCMARLVDRGGKLQAFTHVRSELLFGPAKDGGFGLLDFKRHVLARHAVLAVKLVTGDAAKPWVHIGRAILQHMWRGRWHVMLPLFSVAQHPDCATREDTPAPMPAPLRRIFTALHQLPQPRDVVPHQPLQLNHTCMHFPVLGNPWLQNPLQGDTNDVLPRGPPSVLPWVFRFDSVGRVVGLINAVRSHGQRHLWAAVPGWGRWHLDVMRPIANMFAQRLGDQWVHGVQGVIILADPTEQQWNSAVQLMLQRLGWVLRDGVTVIHLAQLTVRAAYSMLLNPVADLRQQRWRQLISQATGVTEQQVSCAQLHEHGTLMHDVWRRIKWHNQHKQVYWRFVLNGLIVPARFPTLSAHACFCNAAGHACPDRAHFYWNCHAARAVLGVLCTCMGSATLQRRHLWLMELPPQMLPTNFAQLQPHQQSRLKRVLHEVWMVVCLAALGAMGKVANAVTFGMQRLAAHPRGAAAAASELAVVTFWDLLADFTRSTRVPGAWRRILPPDTPFLHFPTPASRLSLNDVPK